MTNRHVVTGRHQHTNELLGMATPKLLRAWPACTFTGLKGFAPLTISLEDEDDSPLWLEHKTLGTAVDVVAIPLRTSIDVVSRDHLQWPSANDHSDALSGRTVSIDQIIDAEVLCELSPKPRRLTPALELFVLGFPIGWKPLTAPQGAFAVWCRGSIASEPEIDWDNLPRFLIDSRTRQGQSGSPVFAFRSYPWEDIEGKMQFPTTATVEGELVGIYSGRIHPDSDLGYVWRAATIREILERV